MSKLVSTVNYPVTVQYDGSQIVVSPREVIKKIDKNKLPGSLPKGLKVIKV
jgi:hypothetical protein